MNKIGITTTVPIEILLAASYQPIDLNNIFIENPNPEHLVRLAERDGFPLNCCSWIKGIYGICKQSDIDTVLCVTSGDCSNTIMLMEVLNLKGFKTIPFSYPEEPDIKKMQHILEQFAINTGTTLTQAEMIRQRLKSVRELTHTLDRLTWQDGLVSGFVNHLWLVSASDFNQDYTKYSEQLQKIIADCRNRPPYPDDMLRIAYIGVPSVFGRDLYHYLEKNGARVVFNEIQRQFAMPQPVDSLAEQYTSYTYPFSIYKRTEDINNEISRRRVDGVIHYVQSFCYRGIGDIIFRKAIEQPVLTLEGNDDFFLNQHNRTRVEAFIDMLKRSRTRSKQNMKAYRK
ncbi:MAG: 2-hydroxyacyl-CoA dehydratase [Dehalococcoidia bacterium]|nr:MAG: 2-hydroxyacyl-CoA dehydratase [Dehalococcoidia bacterium]